jgi:type IV pilus secretin PilQ/predicted competence protein
MKLHYQRGEEYYQQGMFKEAQDEFQKALELNSQADAARAENGSTPSEGAQVDDLLKTGNDRVDMEYSDVPLTVILQSFASTYNLNIVPPKDIKERVTISLKDVTLDEALEAILTSTGYSYYKKGNLIYIYPSVGPDEASLITSSFALKYLTASDAQNLLAKSLSPKGDVKVNDVTNSLIIRDYKPVLEKIKTLLEEIDTPPYQVLIEAKLVDISSTDLQNIGVTYSADYTAPGGFFQKDDETYEGTDEVKGTGNFSGTSSTLTGGQFKLDTFLMKHWNATATIDALVQDRKANILASPSIATLNGKEARIVIGEKVPYKEKTQTTTGTTETTKFIDVGVTLRVTPRISPDGNITMNVHPEVSSVSALLDAGPRITTREADVEIRVKDGQTIVIGGLIKNENNRNRSKVPVLGYVPLVGYLFGSLDSNVVQSELAVFITPHIIKEADARKVMSYRKEEVYVNITGTGERAMVGVLFEKAQNLENNVGIESRRKDQGTRMAEALDMYRTIASQFPGSDRADEALYRAGKLYYKSFRDLKAARETFQKIVDDYPGSPYFASAKYIVKVIQRREEKLQKRKK